MFGNKALAKTVVELTDEQDEQYKRLVEATKSLSDSMGSKWCFMTKELFNKVRVKCFLEGATVAGIGCCAGMIANELWSRYKLKKKMKSNVETDEGL